MDISDVFRLALVLLFTWTGLGCLVGVVRFKYPPLLILGAGYLSWVAAFLLWPRARVQAIGGTWTSLIVCAVLIVIGALCIFGYRFSFYERMKAAGITPRRLFGFWGSVTPPSNKRLKLAARVH